MVPEYPGGQNPDEANLISLFETVIPLGRAVLLLKTIDTVLCSFLALFWAALKLETICSLAAFNLVVSR